MAYNCTISNSQFPPISLADQFSKILEFCAVEKKRMCLLKKTNKKHLFITTLYVYQIYSHFSHVLSPALCEGNFTCKENEVCVRPNECRCRHGYFGASCDTSKRPFCVMTSILQNIFSILKKWWWMAQMFMIAFKAILKEQKSVLCLFSMFSPSFFSIFSQNNVYKKKSVLRVIWIGTHSNSSLLEVSFW